MGLNISGERLMMKSRKMLVAMAGFFLSCSPAMSEEVQDDQQAEPASSCTKSSISEDCLKLLPVPEGLPPTIEVETFRSYATKLASIREDLAFSSKDLDAMKTVAWSSGGKAQFDRMLKIALAIDSDVGLALEHLDTFQDLQFHASNASLGAKRVANALADLRLYVGSSDQRQDILDKLETQIQVYDSLSKDLKPTWLY